ncbi:hypothetical protein [Nostoc commune]|uniref:hypothetical protein n=1 Tax=Nostoc commune TaxID=1178 RepID=UPI0018C48EFC|nr:hypothetical protein [Nostoc commune]MBG1263952.1 hypothetical protein [Nostoc commune BAE]
MAVVAQAVPLGCVRGKSSEPVMNRHASAESLFTGFNSLPLQPADFDSFYLEVAVPIHGRLRQDCAKTGKLYAKELMQTL